MSVLLALLVGVTIAMPHLVRIDRATPRVAATIWLCALVLRAVGGLSVALFVLLLMPRTGLFGSLTRWCWHAVLPFLATHLGFSGHGVGDVASIVPGFALALSTLSAVFAVARAAAALRRALRERAVGKGPHGSVLVGGADVTVAAAGLRRPQVIVSAGAVVALDDDELAAGVDHERGHIIHRHRFLLLIGEICRAIGCFLPGGRAAVRELAFHLERDADRYALKRNHSALALASAICKSAAGGVAAPALAQLNGGPRLVQRVESLLPGEHQHTRPLPRFVTALAVGWTCAFTLAAVALLPAAVSAQTAQLEHAAVENCPS